MLTTGKRRGRKPSGIDGEVVMSFDRALESIGKEINMAMIQLSNDNAEIEEVTDLLRSSARHLAALLQVAKGLHTKGKKSEYIIKREFQKN